MSALRRRFRAKGVRAREASSYVPKHLRKEHWPEPGFTPRSSQGPAVVTREYLCSQAHHVNPPQQGLSPGPYHECLSSQAGKATTMPQTQFVFPSLNAFPFWQIPNHSSKPSSNITPSFLVLLFIETVSCSAAHAGVQWYCRGSLQPPIPELE